MIENNRRNKGLKRRQCTGGDIGRCWYRRCDKWRRSFDRSFYIIFSIFL